MRRVAYYILKSIGVILAAAIGAAIVIPVMFLLLIISPLLSRFGPKPAGNVLRPVSKMPPRLPEETSEACARKKSAEDRYWRLVGEIDEAILGERTKEEWSVLLFRAWHVDREMNATEEHSFDVYSLHRTVRDLTEEEISR